MRFELEDKGGHLCTLKGRSKHLREMSCRREDLYVGDRRKQ